MCGIAGIVSSAGGAGLQRIEKMISNIAYRGPDGSGTVCFEGDGVALGHRRLSILDVSANGAQPMVSASGRFWIVFNGEVYNYIEIRRDLQRAGWSFRSDSDTEVLLAAYEHWGEDCLERLIGMYAFAIWDCQSKELFAARDRLGIKPFYYEESPSEFFFASEIKSILAARCGPGKVATALLGAYMDLGYVPGEHSLHDGIKRLLPGYCLRWRDGSVQVRQYWELRFAANKTLSYADAGHKLEELLRDSIAKHLRSDVPLGVFLSGGLDSSSVVALLAPEVSRGLNTFSVGYKLGKGFDETPYARQVATTFATCHHEVFLTPREFADFIPRFVWHMDEPVTEAAAISLHYVAKLARTEVVVCLSGEGADELFAGYDFYVYNLAMEWARKVLRPPLINCMATLASKISRFSKLRKYLTLASVPLTDRYRGISSYDPCGKVRLYSRSFAEFAASANSPCAPFIEGLFEKTKGCDPLSRMLFFDTKTWLVDDLLIKADRMSMANSIELRVPFLDHRLVEYAAALPSNYKIRRFETKAVLRKCVQKLLPRKILERKKLGFPTPLETMLRGELFDYAHDTLLSSAARSRGYFDSESVRRLLMEHRNGLQDMHREIWQLLVLEEWHKGFGY